MGERVPDYLLEASAPTDAASRLFENYKGYIVGSPRCVWEEEGGTKMMVDRSIDVTLETHGSFITIVHCKSTAPLDKMTTHF